MFYLELVLWVASIVLVWFARDWIQKEKGWLTGRGVINWTIMAVSYINVPILPIALIEKGLQVGLQQWLGTVTSVAGFAFFVLCISKFAGAKGFSKTQTKNDGNFLRGGQRVKAEPHKKLERHIREVERKTGRRPTTIGKLCIHQAEELLNFFFSGSPGSGKSQAFFEVLESVRARRERGIIFDESGDFLRRFYQDGDLIFNPYDQRTVGWTLMNEIRTPKDCATVAYALVPNPEGGDAKDWARYCRDILTVILRRMLERNELSNRTLCDWVMMRSIEDLKQLCQGTPAQRAFEDGAERMTASVMNMLSLAIAPWQDVDDGDFSIRDFVPDDGPKPPKSGQFLFLVADANTIKRTAPVYLTMLNLAAVYLNTLQEDQSRRLWFALDELPALEQQLNELGALLNRARKRGGITMIGMQSVKYFHQLYGREVAETLMAGIGTLLVLRTNSESGAKELAAELGAQDFMRAQRGENRNDSGSGTSVSYQHVQDYKLVTPTEIVNLGPRRGFLKLPGDTPIAEVEIPISPIRPQGHVKYFIEKTHSVTRQKPKQLAEPLGGVTRTPNVGRDLLPAAAVTTAATAMTAESVTSRESDDHEMTRDDHSTESEILLRADPTHALDGFDWVKDNHIEGLGNEA